MIFYDKNISDKITKTGIKIIQVYLRKEKLNKLKTTKYESFKKK